MHLNTCPTCKGLLIVSYATVSAAVLNHSIRGPQSLKELLERELVLKLFDVLCSHRGAALTNSAFLERLRRPCDSRRGTEQRWEQEMTSARQGWAGASLARAALPAHGHIHAPSAQRWVNKTPARSWAGRWLSQECEIRSHRVRNSGRRDGGPIGAPYSPANSPRSLRIWGPSKSRRFSQSETQNFLPSTCFRS